MAISILGVVLVMVGGGWSLIGLYIKSEVTQQISIISHENSELRETLAQLKQGHLSNEALLNSRLVEIETQFRAEDQLRNIQWADMRRTISLLWHRTYNEDYPAQQFYPSIAKEQNK